jgi:hypothetical protein
MEKVEKYLFYALLVCIPISIRHIFNYEAFGFIEWQAIYIYATDILFLILLGWALYKGVRPKVMRADYFLILFVLVSGFSIKNAIDIKTAWFHFIKLFEFILFYFYIKDYIIKRFELVDCFTALVFGGIFQSIISIIQFINQRSLGLKYLGESPLFQNQTGIAAFIVNGQKIIRAYGTTPHSNVLAAYLFLAIFSFYFITIYYERSRLWFIAYLIMLWAFLLTFSRVIISLWLLGFIIRTLLIFYPKFKKKYWLNEKIHRRLLTLFTVTIIIAATFISLYWPYVINRSQITSNDEAIQLRILYNNESLRSKNLLGLGIGNFVPWLMKQDLHLSHGLYQPVHNIYLLVYSEVGIIGLVLFLIFLGLNLYNFYQETKFKKLYHFSFFLVIISILIMGLFDHFLWTIQTGQFIFWLTLGLMAGVKNYL